MKAELVLGNLRREREALNNKLEKLEMALNKDWEDVEQEYLCTQQYNAMGLYAHILDERIDDIESKLEQRKAENTTCTVTDMPDKGSFKSNTDYSSYLKDYLNNEQCKNHCCTCNDDDDRYTEVILDDLFDGIKEMIRGFLEGED